MPTAFSSWFESCAARRSGSPSCSGKRCIVAANWSILPFVQGVRVCDIFNVVASLTVQMSCADLMVCSSVSSG